MNTPAHALLSLALFARRGRPAVTAAAVAGGLLPDASLYLMVVWERRVNGHSFDRIFREEYYGPFWQGVFAVDNSIPLWGLLALAAWAAGPAWALAFAGAGLVHLITDFPLHAGDGRAQFWPLTDWVFHSPVSYWDPNHYGWLVGPLEGLVCLFCAWALWRRFHAPWARAAVAALLAMELAPAVVFPLMFGAAG